MAAGAAASATTLAVSGGVVGAVASDAALVAGIVFGADFVAVLEADPQAAANTVDAAKPSAVRRLKGFMWRR